MVARQLKALAGLAEDPLGSSQPAITPIPDDLVSSPVSSGTRQAEGTHTYMQANAHTHKIKTNL